MRQLPLWDGLGMRRLGWFTLAVLEEFLTEGLAVMRCRQCGRGDRASRHPQPARLADIELWIAYLDLRPQTPHCTDHLLQAHATAELREQPTRSRVPHRLVAVGATDLPNNLNFRARVFREIPDAVHDRLIMGL